MGVQNFHGQGPHPLLLAGSRAVRGKTISGLLNQLSPDIGYTKEVSSTPSVTMAGSKATVRVDNQYTLMFPITKCVMQGDAFSFILFDLVLEATHQKMNITGHIGMKSTQILAHADDVAIMSRSKNSLTHIVFNIEKEAKGRRAQVSENKTTYMQVSRAVLYDEDLCFGEYNVNEQNYLHQ